MKMLAPLALLIPLCVALALPSVVLGLGFAGLIAACFAWQKRGHTLTPLNALKPLGEMSYTLYVTHMPIVVFIGGWLMSRSPSHLLPRGFQFVPLGIAICLIFAWAAHLVVERPFLRPARRAPAIPTATPSN